MPRLTDQSDKSVADEAQSDPSPAKTSVTASSLLKNQQGTVQDDHLQENTNQVKGVDKDQRLRMQNKVKHTVFVVNGGLDEKKY